MQFNQKRFGIKSYNKFEAEMESVQQKLVEAKKDG